MSAPSPNLDRPRSQRAWKPSLKVLLVTVAAFALGLLLFLLLWLDQRKDNDFYRADGAVPSAEGQQFEPLPAPLPAQQDGENASGLDEVDETPASGDEPRIAEAPAAPPAAPAAPPPLPASAAGDRSVPQPVSSPAPRYPRAAQRRGESGTVLLRVHVGADGRPVAVDLVQSSHSRDLDRAAAEAVRRWRFRPALRDGQPVPGIVQIPVTFNLGR